MTAGFCHHCRKTFEPIRSTQKYCSGTCKVAAHRARIHSKKSDFRTRLTHLSNAAHREGRVVEWSSTVTYSLRNCSALVFSQSVSPSRTELSALLIHSVPTPRHREQ